MIVSRGVRILGAITVISIAINLFLAGIQLGHHFRGHTPPMNFQQRLNGVWHDMPADDQTIARGILERHSGDIMDKWRALALANQRIAHAMHANPFDPEEARAAYDVANQPSTELRKTMQDTLIDIAQNISPASRQSVRVHGWGF